MCEDIKDSLIDTVYAILSDQFLPIPAAYGSRGETDHLGDRRVLSLEVRAEGVRGQGTFGHCIRCVYSAPQPVDALMSFVMLVIGKLIIDIQQDQDGTCDAGGQTENIDDGIQFVPG